MYHPSCCSSQGDCHPFITASHTRSSRCPSSSSADCVSSSSTIHEVGAAKAAAGEVDEYSVTGAAQVPAGAGNTCSLPGVGAGGVVTALETSVTVREIDRRVLLVHVAVEVGRITCVWGSDWPTSQTSHSSERRHKGVYFHQTRLRTQRVLTKSMQVRT